MNKSKRICELLGIPYLEWRTIGYESGKTYLHHNPDFTTDQGRVQLLRLMREREDSDRFFAKLNAFSHDEDGCLINSSIPIIYITENGQLVDAVIEWLENHKSC